MPGSRIKKICGCGNPAQIHSITWDGEKTYKSSCSSCRRIARLNRKTYCEKCGNTQKLEIDHIDGNRSNNDINNLQTLCKPCHINKTVENRDYARK